MKAKLILQILLFFTAINLYSQTEIAPVYSPDGEILAMQSKGDTLIVAGSFNHVGKYCGSGALFSTTSDQVNQAFPILPGTIFSTTPDGAGGFYIYGNFRRETELNGSESKRIEHVLADNTFEPNFSLAIIQSFSSVLTPFPDGVILYHNGILYFGNQSITTIAGQASGNLAAIDVTTKLLLPWVPLLTGPNGGGVTHINVSPDGNNLYILGNFISVGGNTREGGAKIIIGSGTVQPWNPRANWDYFTWYADMKFYNSEIILGGAFGQNTNPNGLQHAAARVDTVSGNSFAYLFRSGGFFSNGDEALYFGANVTTMAIDGDFLYAFTVGTFDTRINVVNLSTVNLSTGTSGKVWARYFNKIASATAMKVVDNELYVVGKNFTEIFLTNTDNTLNTNIERAIKGAIKLNKTTSGIISWFPDLAELTGTNVRNMSIEGTKVLLGGSFTHANVLDRGCVYMINTVTDTILPFNINASWPESTVRAMKLFDNKLYLAGFNLKYTNTPLVYSSVLAYNIDNAALSNWAPANLGNTFALEIDNNNVYLGGTLTYAGNTNKNLFAIDRNTGTINTNWFPNPNATVNALHLAFGQLYVGGSFTNISTIAQNRAASFDVANLNITSWNPNANNIVKTIYSKDNTVWLGGFFTTIGGISRKLFAGLDPYSSTLRDLPTPTFIASPVNTIISKGCNLFLGGNFIVNTTDQCNQLAAYYLFNKTYTTTSNLCIVNRQSPFATGINAMTTIGNNLYLGGANRQTNGFSKATFLSRIQFPSGYFDTCDEYITKQDGDWNSADTWNKNVVPISSSKITICHNISITSNATCYTLKYENGGTTNLNNGISLNIIGPY